MTRYLVFLIAITCCAGAFLMHGLTSALETTHRTDAKARYMFSYFIPEGWGFFTRNPREASICLYAEDDHHTLSLLTRPNGSASYFLGASRLGRRYGMEASMLMKKIPDSTWQYFTSRNFREGIATAPHITLPLHDLKNIRYIKKGEYLLVYEESIPWTYLPYADKYRWKCAVVRISLV